MPGTPYIANTDRKWYDFLAKAAQPVAGRVAVRRIQEANFWFPNSQKPHITNIHAGTPVFLRLKSPDYSIAGAGFFASYRMLPIEDAWSSFGQLNGDPDFGSFYRRIRAYRTGRAGGGESDPAGDEMMRHPLACMALRAVEYWPPNDWIQWRADEGFSGPIVTGKFETDPLRASRLLSALRSIGDLQRSEFSDRFQLVAADGRSWRTASAQAIREGQSTFRLRLLDAYGNQCAITGEHTTPVLDAAHIQPYLGPASNHVQNGIVLTNEFHTLFDRGYVTVTPEHRVRISPHLHRDFKNGRRYYPYDGMPLAKLPDDCAQMPSAEALDWYRQNVFRAG